jgi:hypothetical protein
MLFTSAEWTPLLALGRREMTRWESTIFGVPPTSATDQPRSHWLTTTKPEPFSRDPSQAVDLYRKATQQGNPLAGWLAGRLYFLGSTALRDSDAAQKWLKLSADQNNAFGAYYLGRLMADRDYTKAPKLYKIAADQGLPQAQYFYAKALRDGRGIPLDRFTAYVWYTIAADAGYGAAGPDLGELHNGGYLTTDQISEAKAKARDLEQVVIRAVTARGCSGWDGEFDEFPTPPPPKLQRFCH